MKSIILSLTIFSFCLTATAQLNMDFVGNLDYEQNVNDIWGYATPDGREYALVGTQTGLSIVSLLDPENPEELFFIEGSETTWRDIKTWETTAYCVCDNCPDGLMVVDLANLPDAAPFYYWLDPIAMGVDTFESAHNIFIDEFGYGYLSGTNYDGGQTVYIDCFSTPGTPQFVAFGPEEYAHDVYVRDNILYQSEINEGQFAIYDISDKLNSILLATQETPSTFTHNAWLSDDSNILYTTDERAFASTTSYDISDLDDIQLLDRFFSEASIGEATIPHNVHVLNDYLVISHYTDGCVIVDAQYPDNLIEVGNYDTYLEPGTGFSGAWGAYPFLPSGKILISDRQTGLYVLEADYRRASYLEGKITDAVTGANLSGAEITILDANRRTESDVFGNYKTGIPDEGVFDVMVHLIYYEDKKVQATFENNEITILNIELERAVVGTLSGVIVDAGSSIGIGDGAKIWLENDFYSYEATTIAGGVFSIDSFYSDVYQVAYGKWGYKTKYREMDLKETNNSISLKLDQGYEDNFTVDLGWTIDGVAEKGDWVRAVPKGAWIDAGAASRFLSPDEDVAEDEANYCMVTGNGGTSVRDVELTGFTRLTSPPIDMSLWNNPKVSFHRWFSSLRGPFLNNPIPGGGFLDFKIYNGKDTILIEQWNTDTIIFPEWTFQEYKILDYIAATENMQFIFEATGGPTDDAFDESAVDFFRAWDDNADGSQDLHTFEISLYPNPFVQNFTFTYNIGSIENAELRVFDALGKRLLSQKILTTKGTMTFGEGWAAGVYFVQVKCGGEKEVMAVVKY